jgi:uncharacterized protein
MTRLGFLRAVLVGMLGGSGLLGCSHTPTPHYYVLSAATAATDPTARQGPAIGLGPITLPEYLDRAQIVTRATDSRLELATNHRWAEPLAASFARALLTNLEREMPAADIVVHPWRNALSLARQVQIEVTRFDGGPDGAFHLSARWNIATPDARGASQALQSDIAIALPGKADDFDALVAAANSAVAALAKSIAAQLQTR